MYSKYKVMQEVYINKYGEREPGKYYIKYLWFEIFGLEIWCRLRHTDYSGWGDSCEVVTKFDYASEAEAKIKELCRQVHNGKWIKEDVSTHYCNGINIYNSNE